MPIELIAPFVVWCIMFVVCYSALWLWHKEHAAEAAAVLAVVPALLAYAILA